MILHIKLWFVSIFFSYKVNRDTNVKNISNGIPYKFDITQRSWNISSTVCIDASQFFGRYLAKHLTIHWIHWNYLYAHLSIQIYKIAITFDALSHIGYIYYKLWIITLALRLNLKMLQNEDKKIMHSVHKIDFYIYLFIY